MSVAIYGADELNAAFEKAIQSLSPTKLKVLNTSIAMDHRKDTVKHFKLKGTGKYSANTPAYEQRKASLAGKKLNRLVGINPKTKRIGRLRDAVSGTKKTADTIFKVGMAGWEHGTNLPYAKIVQEGSSKKEPAPFLLFDKAFQERALMMIDAEINPANYV